MFTLYSIETLQKTKWNNIRYAPAESYAEAFPYLGRILFAMKYQVKRGFRFVAGRRLSRRAIDG